MFNIIIWWSFLLKNVWDEILRIGIGASALVLSSLLHRNQRSQSLNRIPGYRRESGFPQIILGVVPGTSVILLWRILGGCWDCENAPKVMFEVFMVHSRKRCQVEFHPGVKPFKIRIRFRIRMAKSSYQGVYPGASTVILGKCFEIRSFSSTFSSPTRSSINFWFTFKSLQSMFAFEMQWSVLAGHHGHDQWHDQWPLRLTEKYWRLHFPPVYGGPSWSLAAQCSALAHYDSPHRRPWWWRRWASWRMAGGARWRWGCSC